MPTTRRATAHWRRTGPRRPRRLWQRRRRRWTKNIGRMRRWPGGQRRGSIRPGCATAALPRRRGSALRQRRGNDTLSRMSDYDLDFYAWTERQGSLLRPLAAGERVNDADLNWPNIAE